MQMNTKTFYKFVVSLILVALLFSTGGSVTRASTIDEKSLVECNCCDQTGTKQVVALSQEDPYLVTLQLTSEVKSAEDNFGTLLWDQAFLQSTEGNPWQVVTIPIENKRTKETQLFFAGTQDGTTFRVLVFGLDLEQPKDEASQQSFNGSLKFYQPTGKLLYLAVYQDGNLRELVNRTNEVTPLGLNWGCFTACIGRALPTYCMVPCYACAVVPTPYNPFCYACAGCIGFGAFVCILNCWQ
jgi:hypothetical protein